MSIGRIKQAITKWGSDLRKCFTWFGAGSLVRCSKGWHTRGPERYGGEVMRIAIEVDEPADTGAA